MSRLQVTRLAGGEIAYEDLTEDLLILVKQVQQRDIFVEDKCRRGLKHESAETAEWKFDSHGLLCKDDAVYISKIEAVQQELLKINHNNLFSGHFDVVKTLTLLQQKYYWPGMKEDIKEYCVTCHSCQKTRVS